MGLCAKLNAASGTESLGTAVATFLSLFAAGLALAVRDRRAALPAASVGAVVCVVDQLFAATRLIAQQPEVVRVAAVGSVTQAGGTDSLAADRQTSSIYASTLDDLARRGATLIVTPEESLTTRRAWFAEALAPLTAVLRGVENGFAVARAANHGLLTASDANGRLIAQEVARPDQRDWILADLPLGPRPTLYTLLGNVFPWTTLGLTLLLCVVGMRGEPKDLRRCSEIAE